jgi:ABC-type sugar transport system ATPase subunit
MTEPLLRVRNLTKSYDGIAALKDVSLDVYPGEILALVGENGAGKSTLAKIVSGVTTADSGTVELAGAKVDFHSTGEAQRAGVAIVLQEFNLIPHLTIAENIFLTHRKAYKGGFWVDYGAMWARTEELLARLQLDVHLDPRTKVMDLSVAEQQIVEIVKAVAVDARLLILDEPTATLSRQEVAKLFDLVRRLQSQGVTLMFVSHKLEEIFQLATRVVVLRDGSKVRETPTAQLTEKGLIASMVGRDMGDLYTVRHRREPGEPVLEVRHLGRGDRVRDCSLVLRQGEVVGISGLVGAGRTELVRAIFGADKPDRGQVVVHGRTGWMRSPLAAIRHGIGMIPEDRKAHGLLVNLPVYQNVTLAYLTVKNGFWIHRGREEALVAAKVRELDIKVPGLRNPVGSLSGGNQQKAVIAKWLLTEPDIIVMDEPTRGIDIGAKFELYHLIDRLASEGRAILLVSSELPEILALSDRILVMNQGGIVKELGHAEATEEIIMSCSTHMENGATPAAH